MIGCCPSSSLPRGIGPGPVISVPGVAVGGLAICRKSSGSEGTCRTKALMYLRRAGHVRRASYDKLAVTAVHESTIRNRMVLVHTSITSIGDYGHHILAREWLLRLYLLADHG